MDEKQLFEQAQKMFLADKGRKDVIDFFTSNGIAEDQAEKMATDAFISIKEHRRAMQGEVEEAQGGGSGGGIGSILLGLVFLIGGIVATMSTDSIWYGAIIVGIITLFTGIAKAVN